MLSLLLLACGQPTEQALRSPTHPLVDDLDTLKTAVAMASMSEAKSCEAIRGAVTLAPKVEHALSEGLELAAITEHSAGLVLDRRPVQVDWMELALAAGPGSTATALVSVGGLSKAVSPAGCIDIEPMRRWVGRAGTLKTAPSCVTEVLLPVWRAEVDRLVASPCLCALPERDFITGMSNATERVGLSETTEALKAWPNSDRWVVCSEKPTE